MFNTLLLASRGRAEERRTGVTFLISLAIHVVVLGLAIVIPMWIVQAIPQEALLGFLVEPPPPQPVVPIPPLPPSTGGGAPNMSARMRVPPETFTAPGHVPDAILSAPEVIAVSDGIVPEGAKGVSDGGGIDFGIGIGVGTGEGGVSAGPIVASPVTPLRPPKPAVKARPAPLAIGGRVLESKLVHRVDPIYPELARRTGTSGTVFLQVLINEAGTVEDIKVMKGHPLLNDSAVQAVRQWAYSPTYLNGEPVPVTATVTVHFTLR